MRPDRRRARLIEPAWPLMQMCAVHLADGTVINTPDLDPEECAPPTPIIVAVAFAPSNGSLVEGERSVSGPL